MSIKGRSPLDSKNPNRSFAIFQVFILFSSSQRFTSDRAIEVTVCSDYMKLNEFIVHLDGHVCLLYLSPHISYASVQVSKISQLVQHRVSKIHDLDYIFLKTTRSRFFLDVRIASKFYLYLNQSVTSH